MPEQQIDIDYRIEGIELVEFHLEKKPSGELPSKFHFDVHANIRAHEEKQFTIAFIEIVVREVDKKEQLAKIATATAFYVENFKELEKNEKGVIVVPHVFGIHIRNLAISSTRGILYSYLKGTYLGKAVLPLVIDMIPTQNTPQEITDTIQS